MRHNLIFPILIGHRGMGENNYNKDINYNENTVKGFNEAYESGATYVEFDVQITKDMLPIIYHDFAYNQKLICETDSHEFLASKNTYDENDLCFDRKQSFDKHENHHLSNYKNCSLMDAFVNCKNVGFNMEIKYEKNKVPEAIRYKHRQRQTIEEYLTPILRTINDQSKENIFFSSFSLEVCKLLHSMQSKYHVFYLTETSFHDALIQAKQHGFIGVVLDSSIYKTVYIKQAHFADKKLLLYGHKTNNYDFVRDFLSEGGDGVITDDIESIVQAFKLTQ